MWFDKFPQENLKQKFSFAPSFCLIALKTQKNQAWEKSVSRAEIMPFCFVRAHTKLTQNFLWEEAGVAAHCVE